MGNHGAAIRSGGCVLATRTQLACFGFSHVGLRVWGLGLAFWVRLQDTEQDSLEDGFGNSMPAQGLGCSYTYNAM